MCCRCCREEGTTNKGSEFLVGGRNNKFSVRVGDIGNTNVFEVFMGKRNFKCSVGVVGDEELHL